MANTTTETPKKSGFGLTVIVGVVLAFTAVAVFAAVMANHEPEIHVVNNGNTGESGNNEPPREKTELEKELEQAKAELQDYATEFQALSDPNDAAGYSRVIRAQLDTLRDLQGKWKFPESQAAVAQSLETMFGTFYDQRNQTPSLQRHVTFRLITAFWWIASAPAEGSGLTPTQRLNRGLELIDEALALSPRNAWAVYLRGMGTKQQFQMERALTQQENARLLAAALDDFVAAAEFDRTLHEAWFQAGATTHYMGQAERAATYAWRAVDANSKEQTYWELAITINFELFEQLWRFDYLQDVLDALEDPALAAPARVKVVSWAKTIEMVQGLIQSGQLGRDADTEAMIEQMYELGQKALATAREPELWDALPDHTRIMLLTFAAQGLVALNEDIDGALELYRETLGIDASFFSACLSMTGAAFETKDPRLSRAAVEAWIGYFRARGVANVAAKESARIVALIFEPTELSPGIPPMCLVEIEGTELPLDDIAWLLRELIALRDSDATDDAIIHVLPAVLGFPASGTAMPEGADARIAENAAFYRTVFALARERSQHERPSIRRPSARAATLLALALFRADEASQASRSEISDLLADCRAALSRRANVLADTPLSTVCDVLLDLIAADNTARTADAPRPLTDDERAGLIDSAFICLTRVRDLPSTHCRDMAPQPHRLLNALVDEPLKPDWAPRRASAGADTQALIDEWTARLGR